MTNVTRRSGKRRKRTSLASAPTSSSGASVRSQRPSSRPRRSPPKTWARTASSLGTVMASPLVPDLDHVVEGVAFDRHLPGVTDHPEQLLAGHTGRGGGPRHVLDPFVLERTVDVVGPEVQGYRRRLFAQHHPVSLHV